VAVTLSREAFLEALRVTMYSGARNRQVPMLIHRAYEGDFDPFAEVGISSERGLRQRLALGHLLSVTCAEDVDRITEQEIGTIAGPTLAGEGRVRGQKKMCAFWPRSIIPKDYGEPVAVNVPTLLLSGTLDPVTPPRWGEEAASHLPRSLHLVVPGAHGVGGPCLEGIQRRFLDAGTTDKLDVSCAADIKPAKFQLAVGRQS
jgi:pimeloyl-ACP methyl ester carboxylesterase